MRVLCFDEETFMIEQDKGYPPLVVVGIGEWETDNVNQPGVPVRQMILAHTGELWTFENGQVTQEYVDVGEHMSALLRRADLVVNHRISFDALVLLTHVPGVSEALWEAYEAGKVHCTIQRERLLDNALGILDYWVIPESRGRVVVPGKKPGQVKILFPNPTKLQKKNYALGELCKVWFDQDLDKTTWRTGYAAFYGVPLSQWPEGALTYVLSDVSCAYQLFLHQAERARQLGMSADGSIPGSAEQARADLGLELQSLWGMLPDPEHVARVEQMLVSYQTCIDLALRRFNLVRTAKGKQDGTRDMKLMQEVLKTGESIIREHVEPGYAHPRTDSGLFSTGSDNLDAWQSLLAQAPAFNTDGVSIPFVLPKSAQQAAEYAEKIRPDTGATVLHAVPFVSWKVTIQKMLTTYVGAFKAAGNRPVRGSYVVLQRTGRTSMRSPNLQNVPKFFGMRSCFKARPGYVLCSVDYTALELHTLAQVCLSWIGRSSMAQALNEGIDPHALFAAERLLGEPYDVVYGNRKKDPYKSMRDRAKVANFGLPGGLGERTLVSYYRGAGIEITLEEARVIKRGWRQQWPEMGEYFARIERLMGADWVTGEESATVVLPHAGIWRGRAHYTEACNFPFQGLAAAGAKEAVYALAHACFSPRGILRGSIPVLFVHDEVLMEHPEGEAHDRAQVQTRIMLEAMARYLPDVPPKAEPALMRRWYKKAEPVFQNGILVPWEPASLKDAE